MSEHRGLPLVLTLVCAQFVVMLDTSILNVALPSIGRDLRLDAVGVAWILNAYLLTFGGLLLLSGRAADVVGRRRMMLLGAAVLVAGAVLGATAASGAVLAAARVVQGAGAAMLSPAAMSVLLARFSGPARAWAMSCWGAASTAGGAAGVALGGVLTGALGWRSVLAGTAAVAILAGIAALALVPADAPGPRRRFDAVGAGLLTGAAVAAAFGILGLRSAGMLGSETVLAGLVVVGCLVGFVLVERRSADPVLPLATFRDMRVVGGIAANLLGGAGRIGCFVLVALLLQQVLQHEPGQAGWAMLPTSLAGFAVSTLLLPRALAVLGAGRVAVLGLVLLSVAHLLLASVRIGDAYLVNVLPALVLAAAGVAFSFTPTTLVIAEGLAARNAGAGSGLASATAQLGGAMGVAVFGMVDDGRRAVVSAAGGSALRAAEAGLSTAFVAAAVSAAAGAAVAASALALHRLSARRRIAHVAMSVVGERPPS